MANRYAWVVAVVGLGAACGGSAFEPAPGSGATAGTGGSGGSSGASATGGGGAGGTGGGSGGSGGSVGGSGGSGGASVCPFSAPTQFSACSMPGHACTYPTGQCCSDSYTCSESGWIYEGCVTTGIEPVCPVGRPIEGAPCDPCATPPACAYDECPDVGEFTAYCNADARAWEIAQNTCSTTSCAYGSAFVDDSYKPCVYDTDCTIRAISHDECCTQYYVGVNIFEAQRFEQAWIDCKPQLGVCECAPDLPLAEDGLQTSDASYIGVTCGNFGSCMTYVSVSF